MARLNEPPMSTDCFDTLRRKFLRQNREIAKLNSKQSQRIRELENEYARLLSENLDLSSQVWRLQKELESNSSQRIADHALEVKAKMEAQLAELGSLLAGFGLEPPTKRRSPPARKATDAKHGLSRSPPQRKLRDVAKDSEELAMQEGRLPPISENKRYPRETLNSEEIRALCSEAADVSDSPILGPPPISRFVDEDPIKVESPVKATENNDENITTAINEPTARVAAATPVPKLDFAKKPAFDGTLKRPKETAGPVKSEKASQEPAPSPIPHALRTGSKRKFGDENDIVKVAKSPAKPDAVDVGVENRVAFHELQKQRGIKSLAASGRGQKGKPQRPVPTESANPRRALAVKSTNEDVASPRKQAKDVKPEPFKAAKPPTLRAELSRERNTQRKLPAPVDTSNPPAPPIVTAIIEPETPSPDNPLLAPGTPDHSASRDATRDTPPPADISSMGETSRPSRRARASISYAEPNLRDKMRRPTKEMVDAVSGEGKLIHRSGQKPDHQVAASGSTGSRESGALGSWGNLSAVEALAKESARRQSVLSPLATKESTEEALPTAIATGRRKRMSSVGTKESLSLMEQLANKKPTDSSRDTSPPAAAVLAVSDDSGDVYDFTTSSPMSETKDSHDGENASITAHESSKNRKSSAAKDNSTSSSDLFLPAKAPRAPGSRKRSSMVAQKKASLLELDEPDESNGDDEGPLAKGRLSRRRSMML